MMFGPTLLEYGNEAQKQTHIPPIAHGEVRWCQGFSEPGAGSDLASLQTKCEDKGDHWLVNGQKIWTSRRAVGRLVLLPGAHRHHQEARGHQLPADRHAVARRRGAADQADRRRLAVLRDLLHRREGAEGEPGRAAERRLDHRQAPSAARAQRPLRRRRRRRRRRHVRRRRLAVPSWPRPTSASTRRAGSPIRDLRSRIVGPRDGRQRLPAHRHPHDGRSRGPTRARARRPRS